MSKMRFGAFQTSEVAGDEGISRGGVASAQPDPHSAAASGGPESESGASDQLRLVSVRLIPGEVLQP